MPVVRKSKMFRRGEDYTNFVQRMYPKTENGGVACRNITFQITDDCNMRCSYCYEHHKACGAMSLETGKQVVDYLLNLYEQNDSDFINQHTKGVVLDFIGGEPLLEAELIEHICDYWFAECWRRKIPLGPYTRISFATNGQLWFSPAAQHLFHKYHDLMSVTVSIDGIRELHDKYRLDVNGVGSFDKAWAAFQDGKQYGWLNSKMTFVPDSFSYIYPSIKMMVEQGCKEIHCNYAHEPEYTEADAAALYRELKRVADYLIDEAPDIWVSILGEQIGNPHPEDKNWCGGTGAMLSFAPDGNAYPCIRYAPISVGKELAAPMCLGNCRDGLYTTEQQRKTKEMLDAITLTTQSTQECVDCPVATGCSWCSGFNYEVYGTPNKRVTRICKAHKGRVLASCYFYNLRSIKLGDVEPKKINLPREEAERLIGKQEADALFALEKEAAERWEW